MNLIKILTKFKIWLYNIFYKIIDKDLKMWFSFNSIMIWKNENWKCLAVYCFGNLKSKKYFVINFKNFIVCNVKKHCGENQTIFLNSM